MHVLVTCKFEKDRMKNSREKVATPFLHYNPMGDICCHGNKSSDQIWPKTLCSLSPNPMMILINVLAIGPLVFEILLFEIVYGCTDAVSTAIL